MSLARNVTTVGSATLLSRMLGFLRDVVIAAVLGAGALADAFFVALQIPNLFRRLLAEGALNSAFVPLWLRRRQEAGERGARRFSEDVLGTLGVASAALAVLCVMFAPAIVSLLAPGFAAAGDQYLFAVQFLRLAAPYLAIVGLVAVAAAILNAAGRVGAAACGPIIYNVAMILAVTGVAVFGFGNSPMAGSLLAASIVAAGLIQLVVVGGALLWLPDPPIAPQLSAAQDVRRFFVRMLPGVVSSLIPQLTLIAGTIVASSSPAAVSWLYYTYRLYDLPLGMVSVAIAAVMTPAIAAHVRDGDSTATAGAQSRAFEMALGVALPAAAGLALLAAPIVGGLFERGAFDARDTAAVAAAVAAIALGIPGHALEKVLAAVSFAHEDTRTPMLTALAGLGVSAAGAVILFPTYGHVGIALAIAACGWVGAALLSIVLARRKWLSADAEFRRRLPRIVLATAVMATAVIALQALLPEGSPSQAVRIASMTLLVAAGLGAYLAALHLLGAVRLADLLAAIRPRR